ncbi:hypothetical protein U719_00930 [Exiguobacterium sp. MH3]|nr:hypothetical protein U719_00930 [Exiguobacterium sp. MH3]
MFDEQKVVFRMKNRKATFFVKWEKKQIHPRLLQEKKATK